MQIIVLPAYWTVILCFVVWLVIQVSAALICLRIPDRFFSPNSPLFRERAFEKQGKIYDTLFFVGTWKHLLPDGGVVWKKHGFRKKKLDNVSKEHLERFLVESARGELTHWLAIIPFFVFGFFTPMPVVWIMLVYALAVNLPCIVVQRYNRPRIARLLRRKYPSAEGE